MMVEVLKAIGFSLWQLVVLFIIIFFRKEIREVIRTLVSVKIGRGEIVFNPKKEIVDELKDIKELVNKLPPQTNKEEYISNIDRRIENKYIGALINIKNSTSLLGSKLKDSELGRSLTSKIRASTLEKIESDLFLLEESAYFKYRVNERPHFNAMEPNRILELELYDISPDLKNLVTKAQQY